MKNRELGNYLRTHRKKSGLSQRQVGELLGYPTEAQVSRHERAETVPRLASAFGYQVIFRLPVHALFPGVYENVRAAIEERLGQLEVNLHSRTVRGREAEAIAQILIWMMERRERDMQTGDEG
jgi:transcriptional regulator with XRE-family HTH domain